MTDSVRRLHVYIALEVSIAIALRLNLEAWIILRGRSPCLMGKARVSILTKRLLISKCRGNSHTAKPCAQFDHTWTGLKCRGLKKTLQQSDHPFICSHVEHNTGLGSITCYQLLSHCNLLLLHFKISNPLPLPCPLYYSCSSQICKKKDLIKRM